MPAYVVFDIAIEDPARYERYKELAPPSIAAYGGRYIVRGGTTTLMLVVDGVASSPVAVP